MLVLLKSKSNLKKGTQECVKGYFDLSCVPTDQPYNKVYSDVRVFQFPKLQCKECEASFMNPVFIC